MRAPYRFLILPLSLLALSACEERKYDEALAKIKGMTTAEEVKKALGPADDVDSIGASEVWKYKTETKPICFAVSGRLIMRLATCA
ncbi:MAG: hypothetical protein EP348_04505 [Alphaproteobacteria bacterium]|nr:MAG: hypothetical protein EP348_04505 [Alphaproteobacteria bacterium]